MWQIVARCELSIGCPPGTGRLVRDHRLDDALHPLSTSRASSGELESYSAVRSHPGWSLTFQNGGGLGVKVDKRASDLPDLVEAWARAHHEDPRLPGDYPGPPGSSQIVASDENVPGDASGMQPN